jgi:hypothetical protein
MSNLKGVYISKTKEPPFDLVSTGDFINPIVEVFKLKDSQKTIQKNIPLYLVIADVDVEFIKLEIVGSMTTIRPLLSKNGYDWFKSITFEEHINAIGTYEVIPFYLRINLDDFLDLYNIKNQSSITNFKIKVIWV